MGQAGIISGGVPPRTCLKPSSLSLIGIPVKFHRVSLDDFNSFDDNNLKEIKDFINMYITGISDIRKYNCMPQGIFFYGSNGVGKTMLSSIILKEAYRYRFVTRRITYSSYISLYTSSWNTNRDGSGSNDDFRIYMSCDFLCLEELGKETDTKITKPVLEELLRYREEHNKVTIICTNLAPDTLEGLYGASIMSLIKGNTTLVKITGKDRRVYKD